MNKKLTTFLLMLFLSTLAAADVDKSKDLLRDGFFLAGVDGKVIQSAGKDEWFFVTAKDVKDDKSTLKAGTQIRLLHCSALERIGSDMGKKLQGNYRLWAEMTKYENENFIFGKYFMPIGQAAESKVIQAEPKKSDISINDPNDELAIPEEVIKKLNDSKAVSPRQLKPGSKVKQDSILANRTGFISVGAGGNYVLTLDALGRNRPTVSIELLPCQMLELVIARQAASLEKVRFKVSGLMTQYKGKNYMLLHRAIRAYSYGNFGR